MENLTDGIFKLLKFQVIFQFISCDIDLLVYFILHAAYIDFFVLMFFVELTLEEKACLPDVPVLR